MPRRPRQPDRSRGWCFTINNPMVHGVDYISLMADLLSRPAIKYWIFQLEVGETGTPHFQGYLFNPNKYSLEQVRGISGVAHWEPAGGSPTENRTYCSKTAGRLQGPYSFGECPRQGSRSDLRELAREALRLGSMQALAQEHPDAVIQHGRGLQLLLDSRPPPPLRMPRTVFLYIGPTGTGKTTMALDNYADNTASGSLYLKNSGKWWDFYQQEPVVVWDDFSGAQSEVKLVDLLQLFNPVRFMAPVKNSHVYVSATTLVITTNLHPRNWYEWARRENQYPALARRFALVKYFTHRGVFEDILPDTQRWAEFWFTDMVYFGFQP